MTDLKVEREPELVRPRIVVNGTVNRRARLFARVEWDLAHGPVVSCPKISSVPLSEARDRAEAILHACDLAEMREEVY